MFRNWWFYSMKTTYTNISNLKWTQEVHKCYTQNSLVYWNWSRTTAVTVHSTQRVLLLMLQVKQHTWWWCTMLCDTHMWKFIAVQLECNVISCHVSTDWTSVAYLYLWSMIEVAWKLSVWIDNVVSSLYFGIKLNKWNIFEDSSAKNLLNGWKCHKIFVLVEVGYSFKQEMY